MDRHLGLCSRVAWEQLLEGWTGEGIRTIAAWRRVIVNGPRTLLSFESARGAAEEVRELTSEQAAALVSVVRPLVAVQLLGLDAELGVEEATLELDGAQGPARIVIGRALEAGRVARCTAGSREPRAFVIDYDALHARLAAMGSS